MYRDFLYFFWQNGTGTSRNSVTVALFGYGRDAEEVWLGLARMAQQNACMVYQKVTVTHMKKE